MKHAFCVTSTSDNTHLLKSAVTLLTWKHVNPRSDLFISSKSIDEDLKKILEEKHNIKHLDIPSVYQNAFKTGSRTPLYPKECFWIFIVPEILHSIGYDSCTTVDPDVVGLRPIILPLSFRSKLMMIGSNINNRPIKDLMKAHGATISAYQKVFPGLDLHVHGKDIQSGMVTYNCQLWHDMKMTKFAIEAFDLTRDAGLERKGDDSMLSVILSHSKNQGWDYLIDNSQQEVVLSSFSASNTSTRSSGQHLINPKPWKLKLDLSSAKDVKLGYMIWQRKAVTSGLCVSLMEDLYGINFEERVVSPCPVWWYASKNFGDVITPYLCKKIAGIDNVRRLFKHPPPSIPHLVGCGSILDRCNSSSVSYGCGFQNKREAKDHRNMKFPLSVRGPISKSLANLDDSQTFPLIGDAGFLLPLIYKPQGGKNVVQVGLIPHIVHYNLLLKKFKDVPGVKVINLATYNIENVVDEIVTCEKVISTSLHGFIVAAAYGVECGLAKTNIQLWTDGTKFDDTLAALGISDAKERKSRMPRLNLETCAKEEIFCDKWVYDYNMHLDTVMDRHSMLALFPLESDGSLMWPWFNA